MATRLSLSVLLMASVSTVALAAEKTSKVPAKPGSRIERAGRQIFLTTDADGNGQISQDEFKKSEKFVDLALEKLVIENVIGGAKVLSEQQLPDLSQRNEIGEEDFIDYFQARAAEKDEAVRQQRIARVGARRRPMPGVVSVVASDAGRDRDSDWRERPTWERRRGRCYQGPVVTVTQSVERRRKDIPLGNNPFPIDRPIGATVPRKPDRHSSPASGGSGSHRSSGGSAEKPSRRSDPSSKSGTPDKKK